MLDRKTQMMDAGMVLFETEKPFGTVLGGLKTELAAYGRVLRGDEIRKDEIPDSTGECDLFLDWSTPIRWRCVSCRLEDVGHAGQTAEGEEIRRYAVSFKEGCRNRRSRILVTQTLAAALIILGFVGIPGIPSVFTVIAGFAAAFVLEYLALRPSVKSQKMVAGLLKIASQAK